MTAPLPTPSGSTGTRRSARSGCWRSFGARPPGADARAAHAHARRAQTLPHALQLAASLARADWQPLAGIRSQSPARPRTRRRGIAPSTHGVPRGAARKWSQYPAVRAAHRRVDARAPAQASPSARRARAAPGGSGGRVGTSVAASPPQWSASVAVADAGHRAHTACPVGSVSQRSAAHTCPLCARRPAGAVRAWSACRRRRRRSASGLRRHAHDPRWHTWSAAQARRTSCSAAGRWRWC